MQTGFELTRQDAFPFTVCQPDPLQALLPTAHLIPTDETCYHPSPPPDPRAVVLTPKINVIHSTNTYFKWR